MVHAPVQGQTAGAASDLQRQTASKRDKDKGKEAREEGEEEEERQLGQRQHSAAHSNQQQQQQKLHLSPVGGQKCSEFCAPKSPKGGAKSPKDASGAHPTSGALRSGRHHRFCEPLKRLNRIRRHLFGSSAASLKQPRSVAAPECARERAASVCATADLAKGILEVGEGRRAWRQAKEEPRASGHDEDDEDDEEEERRENSSNMIAGRNSSSLSLLQKCANKGSKSELSGATVILLGTNASIQAAANEPTNSANNSNSNNPPEANKQDTTLTCDELLSLPGPASKPSPGRKANSYTFSGQSQQPASGQLTALLDQYQRHQRLQKRQWSSSSAQASAERASSISSHSSNQRLTSQTTTCNGNHHLQEHEPILYDDDIEPWLYLEDSWTSFILFRSPVSGSPITGTGAGTGTGEGASSGTGTGTQLVAGSSCSSSSSNSSSQPANQQQAQVSAPGGGSETSREDKNRQQRQQHQQQQQASGMTAKLSERDRAELSSLANLRYQQDAIWELLTTEVFYIKRLKVIIDIFLTNLKRLQTEQTILSEIEPSYLVSNLVEIYEANCLLWRRHLLPMLAKARASHCPLDPSLMRNAFVQAMNTFRPYRRYCLEHTACLAQGKQLAQRNEFYKTLVSWCESQREFERLSLKDLLAKPMQRLTRYTLLLKAIAKRTEQVDQARTLDEMIAHMNRFVLSVDLELRCQDEFERLQVMEHRLDWRDSTYASELAHGLGDEIERLIRSHYGQFELMRPLFDCAYNCHPQLLLESGPHPTGHAHSASGWAGPPTAQVGPLKFKDGQVSKQVEVVVLLFTDHLLICKPYKEPASSRRHTHQTVPAAGNHHHHHQTQLGQQHRASNNLSPRASSLSLAPYQGHSASSQDLLMAPLLPAQGGSGGLKSHSQGASPRSGSCVAGSGSTPGNQSQRSSSSSLIGATSSLGAATARDFFLQRSSGDTSRSGENLPDLLASGPSANLLTQGPHLAPPHLCLEGPQASELSRLRPIRSPYPIERLVMHELKDGLGVFCCQLNDSRTIASSFVLYTSPGGGGGHAAATGSVGSNNTNATGAVHSASAGGQHSAPGSVEMGEVSQMSHLLGCASSFTVPEQPQPSEVCGQQQGQQQQQPVMAAGQGMQQLHSRPQLAHRQVSPARHLIELIRQAQARYQLAAEFHGHSLANFETLVERQLVAASSAAAPDSSAHRVGSPQQQQQQPQHSPRTLRLGSWSSFRHSRRALSDRKSQGARKEAWRGNEPDTSASSKQWQQYQAAGLEDLLLRARVEQHQMMLINHGLHEKLLTLGDYRSRQKSLADIQGRTVCSSSSSGPSAPPGGQASFPLADHPRPDLLQPPTTSVPSVSESLAHPRAGSSALVQVRPGGSQSSVFEADTYQVAARETQGEQFELAASQAQLLLSPNRYRQPSRLEEAEWHLIQGNASRRRAHESVSHRGLELAAVSDTESLARRPESRARSSGGSGGAKQLATMSEPRQWAASAAPPGGANKWSSFNSPQTSPISSSSSSPHSSSPLVPGSGGGGGRSQQRAMGQSERRRSWQLEVTSGVRKAHHQRLIDPEPHASGYAPAAATSGATTAGTGSSSLSASNLLDSLLNVRRTVGGQLHNSTATTATYTTSASMAAPWSACASAGTPASSAVGSNGTSNDSTEHLIPADSSGRRPVATTSGQHLQASTNSRLSSAVAKSTRRHLSSLRRQNVILSASGELPAMAASRDHAPARAFGRAGPAESGGSSAATDTCGAPASLTTTFTNTTTTSGPSGPPTSDSQTPPNSGAELNQRRTVLNHLSQATTVDQASVIFDESCSHAELLGALTPIMAEPLEECGAEARATSFELGNLRPGAGSGASGAAHLRSSSGSPQPLTSSRGGQTGGGGGFELPPGGLEPGGVRSASMETRSSFIAVTLTLPGQASDAARDQIAPTQQPTYHAAMSQQREKDSDKRAAEVMTNRRRRHRQRTAVAHSLYLDIPVMDEPGTGSGVQVARANSSVAQCLPDDSLRSSELISAPVHNQRRISGTSAAPPQTLVRHWEPESRTTTLPVLNITTPSPQNQSNSCDFPLFACHNSPTHSPAASDLSSSRHSPRPLARGSPDLGRGPHSTTTSPASLGHQEQAARLSASQPMDSPQPLTFKATEVAQVPHFLKRCQSYLQLHRRNRRLGRLGLVKAKKIDLGCSARSQESFGTSGYQQGVISEPIAGCRSLEAPPGGTSAVLSPANHQLRVALSDASGSQQLGVDYCEGNLIDMNCIGNLVRHRAAGQAAAGGCGTDDEAKGTVYLGFHEKLHLHNERLREEELERMSRRRERQLGPQLEAQVSSAQNNSNSEQNGTAAAQAANSGRHGRTTLRQLRRRSPLNIKRAFLLGSGRNRSSSSTTTPTSTSCSSTSATGAPSERRGRPSKEASGGGSLTRSMTGDLVDSFLRATTSLRGISGSGGTAGSCSKANL